MSSIEFQEYFQRLIKSEQLLTPSDSLRKNFTALSRKQLNDKKSIIKEKLFAILYNYDFASQQLYYGDPLLFFKYFTQALFDGIWIHAALLNKVTTEEIPENYLKQLPNEMDRMFITHLFPNVNEENSNLQKKDFIDWAVNLFEEAIEAKYIEDPYLNTENIEKYFRSIFQRDYLMNCRAVSEIRGVYRTPTPTRFGDEPELFAFFIKHNYITDVIDLRGEKESERDEKYPNLLQQWKLKRTVVNFNEPSTNGNIPGYVRKLMYCKPAVRITVETILKAKGSVILHCASGKDRTGVMSALLQSLMNVSEKNIITEYLNSGHDTRPERIEPVIKFLKDQGGAHAYLLTCDLTEKQITELIKRIGN